MKFKAFNNYMNAVQNAIDAGYNHHPGNSDETFQNNGRWALHLLEKEYADKDQNIRRWLNGKPCVFTSDKTGRKVDIKIGNDREAIYYFLTFCKRINKKQEISEDFRDYLAYLITRSVFGNADEESCRN